MYEMVTGRAAFTGGSRASVIGAILHTEPAPMATLQPMTPPALERLVKTCLSKEPDERRQTSHDVKVQLQWIAEGAAQAGMPGPLAARPN